jgi:hypothetical protein
VQIGAKGSSLISQPASAGIFLVEEVHQEARHAGLGLAALAQEHDVLPAQHRVLDLGHHGLLVAHDAREEALALP